MMIKKIQISKIQKISKKITAEINLYFRMLRKPLFIVYDILQA